MGSRPPMGSRDSYPMSTIRRGPTRGRLLTSRFRNDGRRGMITSRMGGGPRRDMGILPSRRPYRPMRGAGRYDVGVKRINMKMRNTPFLDSKVSRKALIKRALAAAKELDDDNTTENEGEDDDEEVDDEEKDTMESESVKSKKEAKEDEEEDDGDKTVKDEDEDEDADADKTEDTEEKDGDKTDETKEGEEGDGEKKDTPSTPKKDTKKAAAKVKGTPSSEKSVSKDGEKKKKDTKITTTYNRSYIKLDCCHCGMKCITFKEYAAHLFRGLHRAAMRRISGKTREKLMEMRQTQRAAQKEEDEKVEEGSEQKSSYCPLCQLNFRQPKAVHQQSDGHKQMKRFLMPYCATCNIGFKSPMAYETHRASLEHLKFKARVERYANKEDSGEDGAEIDLENFTTVDEVGNVDEPTDSSKDTASTPKKGESTGRAGTDDEDDSDDVDDETVIGGEHVKKVEVQFCDLCNMYLPRRDDEKNVANHCKTRAHLKLYIRQREDKKLRERAERIHKKKLSDAKAKKDAKKEKDTSVSEADASDKPDSDEKKAGEGEGKDSTTDDQLWEVVDNDIGDLLREVGGPGEDAEEEEDEEKTSSERYDKFRHTEKNGLDQKSNIHDSTAEEEEVSTTDKKAGAKKATNGDATAAADKEVKADA